MNTPTASRMGKIWERQIRIARGILNTLIKTHGKSLEDESLHTLLVEVEPTVNSRAMKTETISDVKSDISLSASANLLTMKSIVILPPPACFSFALVEMVQRVPANIARAKNLQNWKKKLSKRRHGTTENRNSLKSLARSSQN